MSSNIIKIAIDLGTTNSSVAINIDGEIKIVSNKDRESTTPSVFGIHKSNNLVVGSKAYSMLFGQTSNEDQDNCKAEVKRIMGTSERVVFPRLDKTMSAEEISSEILKSLKSDVLARYPNIPTLGVVVTIPAHFSTVQAEATKRAAELAGFSHTVLLQEPIAAAMSYGFSNDKDHNWIVYDLGGGTFDVAVISSKGGILSCVNHCGDNFLGGKDFDWLIVDKILIPHIKSKFNVSDFDRGNKTLRGCFSILKGIAENAKKELSEFDKTTIEIDRIGNDNDGKEIFSTLEFTRDQLKSIISPLIDKTITLTKKAIDESGLDKKTIEKIVLVGGPTQIQFLRDRLSKDVGIAVDSSSNPMTAVAHGACVYAGSQIIPSEIIKANSQQENDGSIEIDLNYEPLTSDSEESVSGSIKLSKPDGEYYVQIQSEDGNYSSNKIKLKNGKFYQSIFVQPKKTNNYWIYLLDDKGNQLTLSQDSISITHGLSVSGAPLPLSIGVGITKKEFGFHTQVMEVIDQYFKKNSVLPLKDTKTYKTVRKLTKGDQSNVLPIKVFEGESETPDRNKLICEISLSGAQIPHDLPEGTDIDLTINVDISRAITVEAYIPSIDLRLDARGTTHDEDLEIDQLESDLENQEQRADNLSDVADTSSLQQQIDDIRESLKNAASDEDEKRKASSKLKDLKSSVDDAEKEKGLEVLEKEFEQKILGIKELIANQEPSEQIKRFEDEFYKVKAEGRAAIKNSDKIMLARINEQMFVFITRILQENPSFHVHRFKDLSNGNYQYTNDNEAQYFIKKGNASLETNDLEELKRCNRNLVSLLVEEDRKAATSRTSGITR